MIRMTNKLDQRLGEFEVKFLANQSILNDHNAALTRDVTKIRNLEDEQAHAAINVSSSIRRLEERMEQKYIDVERAVTISDVAADIQQV